MGNVLGTVFDLSLRYLLLLFAAKERPMTLTRLRALDFITTYARDFGMDSENLNGNSSYRFGEYASRCSAAEAAIKRLVIRRFVDVHASGDGFRYTISSSGEHLCCQMNSIYAHDYRMTARVVLRELGPYSDSAIEKMIYKRAVAALERG